MRKFTVIDAKEGTCYLCIGKNSGAKEVVVLDDDTEICPKHLIALVKNGKKESTPLFDKKTA